MDLRLGCFSVKMYVKTKELGPVGGRAPENFICRSANALHKIVLLYNVVVPQRTTWRLSLFGGLIRNHGICCQNDGLVSRTFTYMNYCGMN